MNRTKSQISPPILELLEYARLAPSVHNTQPWRFEVNDSTVSLMTAPDRFLKEGDPTTRELWISLGICFETLLQAAKGLGLDATVVSGQTNSLSDPIAVIRFTPTKNRHEETIDLIEARHSYRGAMKPALVPPSLLEECRGSMHDLPGVSVDQVDNRAAITQIAKFTYQGMRLALSSPQFRKELAELINYNWSSSHIGMHGFVLNRGYIGSIWEKWSIALGIDMKQKARADQQKILESSALIFISTAGDVPSFWFNTGRAYMRVALKITQKGLAQSTIAAPVEAASFHEDIEKILSTPSRIQAMLRVGTPTTVSGRTSPRLSVDELLT